MKKLINVLLSLLFSIPMVYTQAPVMFQYQAVVRNSAGEPLADHAVTFLVSIHQSFADGEMVFSEQHTGTTNAFGLVSLPIGEGTRIYGSMDAIDWSQGPYFFKVHADPGGGAAWQLMGTSQLLSVPYALYSDKTNNKATFEVIGHEDISPDSALFEVKDRNGFTVFAVYETGVVVYIDETAKGGKGGFAVGGRGAAKGAYEDIMRVTSDSVRFYIQNNAGGKGGRGGFAVGGRTPEKGVNRDFMNIFSDTVAEIIVPSEPRLLWYPNKEAFLAGRVLIESPDSVGKNSMATGFESKAIGNWSQALGYQAIARGDYSTAIGKNAIAEELNAFALGNGAVAGNSGSFSFGTSARANGLGSYAFGSDERDTITRISTSKNTMAMGDYSFAIGLGCVSNGFSAFSLGNNSMAGGDFSFVSGLNSRTTSPYSIAIGRDNLASGYGATAIGFGTTSSGTYSNAIGYKSTASGQASVALAYGSNASGSYSTTIGNSTQASGYESLAIGYATRAKGQTSVAMGQYSTAAGANSVAMGYYSRSKPSYSLAIGRFNDTTLCYNTISWDSRDPLFMIGNGDFGALSTAFTVLKNGNVGVGYINPARKLEVNGTSLFAGNMYLTGNLGINYASPLYDLDVAGTTNLGRGVSGVILRTNSDEAIWYDGTYFSWGYGGTLNYFGDPVGIGLTTVSAGYYLQLLNNVNFKAQAYAWNTYSDSRVKSELQDLPYGLNEIMALKPKMYIQSNSDFVNGLLQLGEGRKSIGLIAQEIFPLIPEAVSKPSDETSELWSMDYSRLIPVLIKGMQEQQSQIESIHQENEQLKARNKALENQVSRLESMQAQIDELRGLLGASASK